MMDDVPLKALLVKCSPLAGWAYRRMLSEFTRSRVSVQEAGNFEDIDSALEQSDYDITILCKPGFMSPPREDLILNRIDLEHTLAFFEQGDWPEVEAFLEIGGRGCVSTESPPLDFRSAILATLQGITWVSPVLREPQGEPDQANKSTLTTRETEIVQLLARGFTNRQIADKLCISLRTAETHRNRIYRKLGVNNRAQVVSYSLVEGLLRVENTQSQQ